MVCELRFPEWTCSTPSDGRCATCASRSPTAATSAASTACRRRSTAATIAFLERRELLTFEEITRVAAALRRAAACRRSASPAASRSCGATSSALIAQLAELDVRSDADDQRLAAPAEGTAARRCRPAADHGQPRFARRRAVSRAERRRLSGRPRARGHRRGGRRRGCPVKVNAVIKRGVNDDQIVPMARASSANGATRCASSSSWTSGTRTAGASTTSSRPRRSSARSTRRSASSPSMPATAARSRSAGATRTARGEVGVIASVTQPFCGDCTRARLSAEGKLFTCLLRRPRPRPAGADSRRRLGRGARRPRSRTSGKPAKTAIPSSAPKRPNPCQRWR